MNTFSLRLCLILLFSFSLAHALAASESHTVFDNPYDRAQRLKYATNLLREVNEVYVLIPNLEPDKLQWLKEEHQRILRIGDASVQLENQGKLWASKEYRLFLAKDKLGELITLLEKVSSEEQHELTLWIEIAHGYFNWNTFDAVSELERLGVITFSKSNEGLPKDIFQARLEGLMILKYIAVPLAFLQESQLQVLTGSKPGKADTSRVGKEMAPRTNTVSSSTNR